MNIIVLDCETTGLNKEHSDYVIDVCIRHVDDAWPVRYWRIRPPKTIPPEIQAIHGISDEMVADCPTFAEIADDLRAVLQRADVIVGYNPDFDVDILRDEFRRAVMEVKWPKLVLCLKRLWDRYDPAPRHLIAAVARFCKKDHAEAHSAVADVAVTRELWHDMRRELKLLDIPIAELDPDRAKWCLGTHHFVWRDSYQDDIVCAFGKHQGKSILELDNGYFHWMQKQDFPSVVKDLGMQMVLYNSISDIDRRRKAITDWVKGQ